MKVLNREDLLKLIQLSKIKKFDLRDFRRLFERFGDDYFLCDGKWIKFSDNKDRRKYIKAKDLGED